MSRRGEAAHVGADFGQDDLSGERADARDGREQRDRLTERVEVALHLGVDGGDGGGSASIWRRCGPSRKRCGARPAG